MGRAPAVHRGGLEGWRRLAGHARRAREGRQPHGIIGQGGYEGIQNDSDGNLWIVEDAGGPNGTANPHAKQPNSFLFRFKPYDRTDLTKGGKLQALQVTSLRSGQPIAFHSGQADADIKSDDTKDLHTYGHSFATRG